MKFALKTAIAAAFAATALSGASAGAQSSDYYYQVYFYSDASMTEIVGEYRQYCLSNQYIMTPLVSGVMTEYSTQEAIGRCPGLGDW